MRKIVLLIIFVMIVTLATSGCSQYFPRACTQEAKICENGRSVGRVGPNCEFAPCELPSSLEECDSKDEFWKNWCYMDYAVEVASDPAICDKIRRYGIRNMCYMKISNIASDIEVCEQLGKFRDRCIVQVSKTSTNPEICSNLNAEKKAECYYRIGANTGDAELCEKAEDYFMGDFEFRYLCLRDIAINKNNSDFCNNLDNLGFSEYHYKRDCLAGFGIRT
jgi:hypothetical protein